MTIARREIRKWLRESAEGQRVEEVVGELLGDEWDKSPVRKRICDCSKLGHCEGDYASRAVNSTSTTE